MHAIAKALRALPSGPYLLAVSGGRDSMVLLHAFADERPGDLSAVATFDHGTGAAAAAAVDLVVRDCLHRGVSVVAGRAPDRAAAARASESLLREARWAFLRAVAEERRAVIVTAHTRDDQAETVAMRILRDASARGLSGMAGPAAGVARPLLGIGRLELAEYARDAGVPFVQDPSNADPAYLRNRLRTDVLAAAEKAHPGFTDALVVIGERAARWRLAMARLVDALEPHRIGDALVIEASVVEGLSADGLSVVWPELAGRLGVVMDRRGVERMAAWTPRAKAGQRVPLSGGATVERTARTFVVRVADGGPTGNGV